MGLNEQEIQSHYGSILRRAPMAAEVTYWLCFSASGGRYTELRIYLASGLEFEAVLREEFLMARGIAPSRELVESCRIRVVAGEAIRNVVQSTLSEATLAEHCTA